MIVKMQCPQCGAQMEFDDSRDVIFCSYCGNRIANVAQKVNITQNVNVTGTVTHVADRSNEPNVLIDFASTDPSAALTVSFSTTKIRRVVYNGQTAALRLPSGPCDVFLGFAGKSYRRSIYVVETAPVRINASMVRGREIVIDQPPYMVPPPYVPDQTREARPAEAPRTAPQAANPAAESNSTPGAKASLLAILGFVLSLTYYLSPIGAALCGADFVKNKERPHGLSVAGIVIGVIMTVVLIASLFRSRA